VVSFIGHEYNTAITKSSSDETSVDYSALVRGGRDRFSHSRDAQVASVR
jgi:hypothetical protein